MKTTETIQITGLERLVLNVADIARSTEFYTAVLGMTAHNSCLWSSGACVIQLHARPGERLPAALRPLSGSADFCLACEGDPRMMLRHLARHRVAVAAGPLLRTADDGTRASLFIHDPDGNLLELAFRRAPESSSVPEAIVFRAVSRHDELATIALLAREIWPAVYDKLLKPGQFDYMMNRMYSPEVMRRELESGVRFDLIEDDGLAVGFTSYGPVEPDGVVCPLHKIYLLGTYQHRGLGGRAIRHAAAWARKFDARRLELHVNKGNGAAIRAYLRHGFTAVDSVTSDIGGGYVMDDYIMALELLPAPNGSEAEK